MLWELYTLYYILTGEHGSHKGAQYDQLQHDDILRCDASGRMTSISNTWSFIAKNICTSSLSYHPLEDFTRYN